MTEIRRLFQQGKEFVPISLAEAVVVNTNNLPGFNSLKITTLDRVLYSLTGVVGTNTINIKNLQDTKQDKLTAGHGIVIKDGVISIFTFSDVNNNVDKISFYPKDIHSYRFSSFKSALTSFLIALSFLTALVILSQA